MIGLGSENRAPDVFRCFCQEYRSLCRSAIKVKCLHQLSGGGWGDLKDGSRRRSIFRAADVGIFLKQS